MVRKSKPNEVILLPVNMLERKNARFLRRMDASSVPRFLRQPGWQHSWADAPAKTRTNPSKPKWVKGRGISKIDLGPEKQTQLGYLVFYQ